MPDMIGRIRYSPARGVSVRQPGDMKSVHSAVSGTIAVYTDTLIETNFVIEHWDEIIQAANDKAIEILSNLPNTPVTDTEG